MSIMVKIYDTDPVEVIAKKIYNDLDVMMSCTIFGFIHDIDGRNLTPKGEIVLNELKRLDDLEHIGIRAGGKYRKYKFKENSVGGPIAHKIFTYEKRMVDSEPRCTIWRFQ